MIYCDLSDVLILIGRTHPLLVHLPIGILFIGAIFEMLALIRQDHNFSFTLSWIWFLAMLTAVFSSVAGLLLAQEGGYDNDLLNVHQWSGLSVAALTVILLVSRIKMHWRQTHRVALSFVGLILVSVAGHFGGSLTHGDDFLTSPLLEVIGMESDVEQIIAPRKPIENMEEALVYQDLVEPVLEQKCFRCHSSKKQKGKLRLDEYQFVVAGGKNGSTLVPGKPMESELYKRLTLPKDDKHRMPPKGKSQMSKYEINLIHWWIESANGSNSIKVAQVERDDSIRMVLTKIAGNELPEFKKDDELPEVEVTEVSEESLKPLRDAGLIVRRFAPELPFLTVNCVNAPGFNDEQAKLLVPFADQIIWLKAGSTKLTDTGMAHVSKLKNLTRLSVEYTNITDAGLVHLKNFPSLVYLNVVGTNVSDKSVTVIRDCNKLRSIYLWQSRVTKKGAMTLKEFLPDAKVNLGDDL
jgi:uncharacterized membrane protein